MRLDLAIGDQAAPHEPLASRAPADGIGFEGRVAPAVALFADPEDNQYLDLLAVVLGLVLVLYVVIVGV